MADDTQQQHIVDSTVQPYLEASEGGGGIDWHINASYYRLTLIEPDDRLAIFDCARGSGVN